MVYDPGPLSLILLEKRFPGQPRDKHGRFGHGGGGLTGQDALDAVPGELVPGPRAHFGDYEGTTSDLPAGAGDPHALAEYEGVEYQTTNTYLRGGYRGDYKPPGVDERVTQIDQTMRVSRLTDDVVVERGITNGSKVFGSDAWHGDVVNWDDMKHGTDRWDAGERPNLTGASWTERAYVSTSADGRVADQFVARHAQFQQESGGPGLDGEPVVMRISAPAGTGAVQLGSMTPAESTKLTGSAEILLQRGLRMEVTADHGVDDSGIRRIDVKAVPLE